MYLIFMSVMDIWDVDTVCGFEIIGKCLVYYVEMSTAFLLL